MAPPEAEETTIAASIFDNHNPPSSDLIRDCVHCGFCLPTCPSYALWREEMDSPRGRIYLMKLGHEGNAQMTESFVGHFDHCLGCMACVTACPSGVQYDKLIEATRAQIQRNFRRPWASKLHRRFLFALFPHPRRLRLMIVPAWVFERSGLRRLVRTSGLLKLFPEWLRSMEALLPEVRLGQLRSSFPEGVPAQGVPRRRVGLLLGCVQRIFFSDVNAATAHVLAVEGCEVVVPRRQGCCGALLIHAGEEREALEMARGIIDAFERTEVDTIVTNAAGCGSHLKDLAYLLRNDRLYAGRAKAFSAKCRDVSEVLAELEPRAPRHPLPLRVAYQDSCHLQHAQRVVLPPRQVLKSIPQLELLEVPDAAICCGSAGIYNLIEPAASRELGDRKVRDCLATGAEVIISGNPGCLLQIRAGLVRAGRSMPLMHSVQLLEASIRGASKDSLLQCRS